MQTPATLVTRSLRYFPCNSSAVPQTQYIAPGCYVQTVDCFYAFSAYPTEKSQLVFLYRHLFLPFPFIPHKEHSIINTSDVPLCTSSPTALLIIFWYNFHQILNASKILRKSVGWEPNSPCARTDGQSLCPKDPVPSVA